ncbi:tyrosine-type recombinase/integrase [Aerococcaceae bacterium WGS1372]
MKFKDLCDEWLELYKTTVKGSTFKTQKTVLNKHVLPYYGDMYVDKITISHCQKYANQQAKKLVKYHNSVNLPYRILQHGVHLGYIKENPATNIIRPKASKSNYIVKWWNKQELNKFMDCVDNSKFDSNVKTQLRLLAYTGMRKGEALALLWSDIDFDNNLISITKTVGRTEVGYEVENEGSKTVAGNRVISVDVHTMQALKLHRLEQKKMLLMLGLKHKGSNQLVFSSEKNELLYSDFINYYMNKIITDNNLKHITVHQLRHTHISLLFEIGTPIKEVQDRVGHKDYKTTMDIYNHVNQDKKDKTASEFAEFLAN